MDAAGGGGSYDDVANLTIGNPSGDVLDQSTLPGNARPKAPGRTLTEDQAIPSSLPAWPSTRPEPKSLSDRSPCFLFGLQRPQGL